MQTLESVERAVEVGWVLADQWISMPQKIDDDSGYGTFFIGVMAFYTIWNSNKAIEYLLKVEVTCGNLLMEVIGGSDIKARGIHYGVATVASQVADEVLDSL